MKKFALIILAALMVLAVSCKQEPENTAPVDKAKGQEKLLEQGSTSRAVDHTGFSIKITAADNGDESKFWLGGKNGTYWVGAYDEETGKYDLKYFKEDGDIAKIYAAGLWISAPVPGLKDCIFTLVDSVLYKTYAPIIKDHLVAGKDATVNGRSCFTYTFGLTIGSKSASVKFYVDKEYGCTLKAEYTYSDGTDVVGSSISLEGSKFSNVTSKDLPDGFPGV